MYVFDLRGHAMDVSSCMCVCVRCVGPFAAARDPWLTGDARPRGSDYTVTVTNSKLDLLRSPGRYASCEERSPIQQGKALLLRNARRPLVGLCERVGITAASPCCALAKRKNINASEF